MQTENKIIELESLRGLAALLVVFFHIPAWNEDVYNITLFRYGYLMVDFFFVLSGFVIYRTYSTRLDHVSDIIRFQLLRFGRLYPVHAIYLLIFLAFEILKHIASTRMGGISPTPFSDNNMTAFIQQAFLVQSIAPSGYADSFNYPAWSISVEFYSYILFALSVLIFKHRSIYVFVGTAVISMLYLCQNDAGVMIGFLKGISGFSMGCLLARFLTFSSLSAMVLTGALAALSFVLINEHSFDVATYLLSAAFMLCLLKFPMRPIRAILQAKACVKLGEISYSLYMCHAAVIWIYNQFFKVSLHRPVLVFGGTAAPQLQFTECILAYSAVAVSCLCLAYATYVLVEKPCRLYSRQMLLKKS